MTVLLEYIDFIMQFVIGKGIDSILYLTYGKGSQQYSDCNIFYLYVQVFIAIRMD